MQEMVKAPEQALTPSEWIKLCEEWEHSGEKQQAFCEKRKINYTTSYSAPFKPIFLI